jgi:hypothetical protein
MAVELWLRRSMDHLVPANAEARELMRTIKDDRWVLCEVRNPRNVKHHRKYFALLQAVFPHQSQWPTFKSFQRQMKKALGHGEWVVSGDGKYKDFIEDSISFASMDQDEFEEFYSRALEIILTRILPSVDLDDLNREVADILEGRKAA